MIYELCDDLDSTRDPGISFISTSSFVRIRFTSDLSVRKKGFRANYTVVESRKIAKAHLSFTFYLK